MINAIPILNNNSFPLHDYPPPNPILKIAYLSNKGPAFLFDIGSKQVKAISPVPVASITIGSTLSGKGGVGKSTVAANLALALANSGSKVGLLDVDLHGPSIPVLFGLQGKRLEATQQGKVQPFPAGKNLGIVSIGMLMADHADAIVWRGPMKTKAIQQFVDEVDWGELDYLVVDCPPGTGDEPLSVAQMLGSGSHAILVTTPQQVAVADVRRSISFCKVIQLPIIGVIENMSGLVCPHCGKTLSLFGSGGGEQLAREGEIPFLGRIPIDPDLMQSGDNGTPLIGQAIDSPAFKAIQTIIATIQSSLIS